MLASHYLVSPTFLGDALIHSPQMSAFLSARMPSVRRLNRQPVCLRRRPCGLRTDRNAATYVEWTRSPLEVR